MTSGGSVVSRFPVGLLLCMSYLTLIKQRLITLKIPFVLAFDLNIVIGLINSLVYFMMKLDYTRNQETRGSYYNLSLPYIRLVYFWLI